MEEQNIKLVQKPVIQHKLVEVGKSVTKRINDLNLDKLVATDDTIQSLKQLRAELNKEFTEFENQRKTLKEAVANPYMEFENVYKTEITEKFKDAVNILKTKIGDFEEKVKKEKKANIEQYFKELCQVSKIDFLKFSDTGIDVNLSTSEKKYKEECNSFVERIADDIILIDSVDFPAETMTEYKSNGFNASKAITVINERKEAERLEAERIKQAEIRRRESMLRDITMVYHDMTHTFNWVKNDSVFIERKELENLSKEDFQKRYVELEATIKSATRPEPVKEEEPPNKQEPVVLQSPKVVDPEVKEKTVTAAFECVGTMKQLLALGQYMKTNGITYKNI